jgi:hypothetical protein
MKPSVSVAGAGVWPWLTVVVDGSRCHFLQAAAGMQSHMLPSAALVCTLDFPGLPPPANPSTVSCFAHQQARNLALAALMQSSTGHGLSVFAGLTLFPQKKTIHKFQRPPILKKSVMDLTVFEFEFSCNEDQCECQKRFGSCFEMMGIIQKSRLQQRRNRLKAWHMRGTCDQSDVWQRD